MSLIPTANAGAPVGDYYFIENIGGPGTDVAIAPCVKGTSLGTIRVGNPDVGVIIRGDTVAPFTQNRVSGGAAAGGTLTLGSSQASPNNIALTDNTTTISGNASVSGIFSVPGVFQAKAAGASPASLDTYISRDVHGFSDTGYSVFTVPFAGGGAVANPPALSPGLWSVIVVPTGAGNENAQASACCYWDGTAWTGNGVSFNFTGGSPNVAIGPVAGGATMNIGGAGIPAAGNVLFRQLLAAP
jgi:hypothetical protein